MSIIQESIVHCYDKIAQALALAFANGDKNSINKHYFNIKNALSKTKIHVTNDMYPFTIDEDNQYLNTVLALTRKIDKKYNTTIEKNILDVINDNSTPKVSKTVNDPIFHHLFIKLKPLFDSCLVDEVQAYNIYKKDENLFKTFIYELTDYHQKTTKMKDEMIKDIEKHEQLSQLSHKITATYNLYTYEDILEFYNQLNALIVDTSALDHSMLVTINDYKNKALEKEKLKQLSTTQIKQLIRDTKSLLDDKILKSLLQNIHIKAYFKSTKLPLSSLYLNAAISGLKILNNKNNLGITLAVENNVICIFKASLIELHAKNQHDVILHELIHSYTLNSNSDNDIEYIYENYLTLDELLTEYLSRKAMQYLDDYIIKTHSTPKMILPLGYTHFDPIMKELDNTPVMNTLIDIKVNNDYKNIETRIDKETLSLLISYLDKPNDMEKFNKIKTIIKRTK